MTTGRGGYLISVLLAVALIGLLAFVLHRHDLRADVTYGQRATLAPQTIEVLKLVQKPIHVTAFYRDIPQERQVVLTIIEMYQRYTDHLTLEFADLDRRPELAEAAGVSTNRTLVFSSGDLQVRTSSLNEADLTAAIVRLIADQPPRVLFLTGQGQASIEDAAAGGISRFGELVRQQNFRIGSFSLAGASRIPPGTDCVVLAGPEQRMTESERAALVEYLLRGGRMLAMLEPLGASDVDSMLTNFGVVADSGFVVDPTEARRNITGAGNYRIVLSRGGNREHRITRDFTYSTLFPLARSLTSVQPPPPGLEVTRLIATDPAAWAEREITQLIHGEPEYDADVDGPGPLGLAYAVSANLRRFSYGGQSGDVGLTATLVDLQGIADVRNPAFVDSVEIGDTVIEGALNEEARLVVTGDVDFINNANLLVRGNSSLALGMLLWLTEQESRIALTPPPSIADPIVLTRSQIDWIRILGIGVGPAIPILLSFVVLWRRRQWV